MTELASQTCSFCRKHKDHVQKLIVSDTASICNECVHLCQNLLIDKSDFVHKKSNYDLDPINFKNYLDSYVVGQDAAKITLAVAIVNHYKRIQNSDPDMILSKANICLIGPTGSGKTLLAKTVAKLLDVPFAIADATSVTEAGYAGDDVESLISRLYANSGNDINKTQHGIVFIDEIDKISRKNENTTVARDVSGEGVQQALLKIVEGTICRIPSVGGRKHPSGAMIEIDTTNILFIAGGAFVGLTDLIQNRINGSTIGFNSPVKTKSKVDITYLVPDDLVKYGMIPEFVGRFPTVIGLEELTHQDLHHILTKIKNNLIAQYQWLFEQDGVKLEFTTTGIEAILDRSIQSGTGARSLQTEIERTLMPHMFNLKSYKKQGINRVDITETLVNNPGCISIGDRD